DEDHDDEEDLPRDADVGIPRVADEVDYHHVIDDALQAAEGVLQHGGPGESPDRRPNRPVDNTPVEPPTGCRSHDRAGSPAPQRRARSDGRAGGAAPQAV